MYSLVCTCVIMIVTCNAQLVINVRNRGGEIVKETLTGNSSEQTIILEFQRPEGTVVTQLIDFRSEVLIFRLLILGEEERGQNQYQVMCFVSRIARNKFISPDAMSKLRQRNPAAIRQPEEDLSVETYEMDVILDVERAHIISSFLPEFCQEASNSTYARQEDLQTWTKGGNQHALLLLSSSHQGPVSNIRCPLSNTQGQTCHCQLDVCVGWYPCGLKYCRGKDLNRGKASSYRCGIKTCRKCYSFQYAVASKQHCLWDN